LEGDGGCDDDDNGGVGWCRRGVTHGGSLDPPPRLGAGPPRAVDQKVAALLLQTREHLTPLPLPHDGRWEGEMSEF